MKTSQTVTLRIPSGWAGRLDSSTVRAMLAQFLQRPSGTLPPDPGAGDARISLSLSPRVLKVVSGVLGDAESVALRRVIAANLRELPAMQHRVALPVPRAFLASSPVLVGKPQERAGIREKAIGDEVAPAWYHALPAWESLSSDTRAFLESQHPQESSNPWQSPVSTNLPKRVVSDAPEVQPIGSAVWWLALFFAALILLLWFAGKPSQSISAASGPRFRPWSPKL